MTTGELPLGLDPAPPRRTSKHAGVYPPGATVRRAAIVDGPYRYVLGRRWADDGPVAVFLMLNPSTADADFDDPTLRRVVGYSVALGAAAVTVVNLYAYRTAYPDELLKARRAGVDVVGPRNDELLIRHTAAAAVRRDPIVVGWGARAAGDPRVDRVLELLTSPARQQLTALAVLTDGTPRHPLMLEASLRPQPWQPRR